MSERKFQVPADGYRSTCGGIGPAGVYRNEEPYPVEVTVRRVAEKVEFQACLERGWRGPFLSAMESQSQILNKGFQPGQRVRVTIEPLSE